MSEFRRRQMIAAASGKRQIVWNQMIKNGNFVDKSNWSNFQLTSFTVSNNTAICYLDSSHTSATGWYGITQSGFNGGTIELISGHKYYICALINTETSTSGSISFARNMSGSVSFTRITTQTWVPIGGVVSATNTDTQTNTLYVRKGYIPLNVEDTTMYKNIMMFDLTMMFGQDNEPTKAEFEAMFNLPYTYYPYNAGEVMYI